MYKIRVNNEASLVITLFTRIFYIGLTKTVQNLDPRALFLELLPLTLTMGSGLDSDGPIPNPLPHNPSSLSKSPIGD